MVVNDFEGRLKVLGGLIVLVIAILIGRIGYLQVYDGEYYSRPDVNATDIASIESMVAGTARSMGITVEE